MKKGIIQTKSTDFGDAKSESKPSHLENLPDILLVNTASYLNDTDAIDFFFRTSKTLQRLFRNETDIKKLVLEQFKTENLIKHAGILKTHLNLGIFFKINEKFKFHVWGKQEWKSLSNREEMETEMGMGVRMLSDTVYDLNTVLTKTKEQPAKISRVILSEDRLAVFVITHEGTVYATSMSQKSCLGVETPFNVFRKVELPQKVIDVFSTRNSTFFITEHDVYACGQNQYGQLGIGERIDPIQKTPAKMTVFTGVKIRKVFSIHERSFGDRVFFDTAKGIFVTGHRKFCLCGLPETADEEKNFVTTPTKLNLPSDLMVYKIILSEKSGSYIRGINPYPFTVFMLTNKGIFTWGNNSYGRSLGKNGEQYSPLTYQHHHISQIETLPKEGTVIAILPHEKFTLFAILNAEMTIQFYGCGLDDELDLLPDMNVAHLADFDLKTVEAPRRRCVVM